MGLASGALAWADNGLLALLIYRGWKGALLSRYRYFYLYVASVVGAEVIQLYLSGGRLDPGVVVRAWWILEFVTAVLGFGVTWEIYRHVLAPFSGVRRMARWVMLSLGFAVVIRTATQLAGGTVRDVFPTTIALEQGLRAVQAFLLVAILSLIVHYGLPLGRNLRALLAGYSLYVGASLVSLSAASHWGQHAWSVWAVLPQLEYGSTLGIWCFGMWAYFPNPAPDRALEREYAQISAQTARAFGQLRTHLMHSWRI